MQVVLNNLLNAKNAEADDVRGIVKYGRSTLCILLLYILCALKY